MLSIGVLSWKAHVTLRKTLTSYEALLPLADEKVIFFNEITDADRAIAEEFGFCAEGSPTNLGIMGGITELLHVLHGDTVLLLQNDCPVCVPPEVVKRRLAEAVALVESDRVKLVQLHERLSDGATVDKKFRKFYPGDNEPETLKQRLLRLLRPCRAKQTKGRAIWSLEAPEVRFPEVFTREGETLLTTSAYINYTEQPHLAKRAYLEELFAYCHSQKHKHHTLMNGNTTFEIILNGPWWRKQALPIGISDGIFAHARFDDSFRASNPAFNPELTVAP